MTRELRRNRDDLTAKRLPLSQSAVMGNFLVWFRKATIDGLPALLLEGVFDNEAQREAFIAEHCRQIGFMGEDRPTK